VALGEEEMEIGRKSLKMVEALETTETPVHCWTWEEYWEVVESQHTVHEEREDPVYLETVYMRLEFLQRRYELALEEILC
jgi:hypothetical protein